MSSSHSNSPAVADSNKISLFLSDELNISPDSVGSGGRQQQHHHNNDYHSHSHNHSLNLSQHNQLEPMIMSTSSPSAGGGERFQFQLQQSFNTPSPASSGGISNSSRNNNHNNIGNNHDHGLALANHHNGGGHSMMQFNNSNLTISPSSSIGAGSGVSGASGAIAPMQIMPAEFISPSNLIIRSGSSGSGGGASSGNGVSIMPDQTIYHHNNNNHNNNNNNSSNSNNNNNNHSHSHHRNGGRARRRFSQKQIDRLTSVMQTVTDTPSFDLREQLGRELGMTNREVQVWFQNRRAKAAKMKAQRLRFIPSNPNHHNMHNYQAALFQSPYQFYGNIGGEQGNNIGNNVGNTNNTTNGLRPLAPAFPPLMYQMPIASGGSGGNSANFAYQYLQSPLASGGQPAYYALPIMSPHPHPQPQQQKQQQQSQQQSQIFYQLPSSPQAADSILPGRTHFTTISPQQQGQLPSPPSRSKSPANSAANNHDDSNGPTMLLLNNSTRHSPRISKQPRTSIIGNNYSNNNQSSLGGIEPSLQPRSRGIRRRQQ